MAENDQKWSPLVLGECSINMFSPNLISDDSCSSRIVLNVIKNIFSYIIKILNITDEQQLGIFGVYED